MAAPGQHKLLVLYVDEPVKYVLFLQQLGLVFVEERHGDGPNHWACEVNGTVLEVYPKVATMAHSPKLVRVDFR